LRNKASKAVHYSKKKYKNVVESSKSNPKPFWW